MATEVSLRKDRSTGPPFSRVLVANRGEIALRIIRACHELGAEAVAVYSDADAASPHVRAADLAVNIGPPAPAQSYLRADAIIDAAQRSGAQAIHPGYGFLSEQPRLATGCVAAGIVFVGPTPATLAGLGDKLAARRTAAAADVPTVPGTFEPLALAGAGGPAALARAADEVGFPLLVKAAAGGGGRGMRRVDDPADLAAAAASASREAAAAFGDGSVYLERYVEGGRHVEVQLLGDEAGAVVALGERDCSVQRRHQKLVEEAPAPGLTRAQRIELYAHALDVARAVGLRNAATAEFLLTTGGEFWFLEVNARLQVEHGITELVTGIDLVHEQLWLAAGRPLTERVIAAAEAAAEPSQHAIEVRISAEDPAREFAPVLGRLSRWRVPAGPGIRVDAGVEEGSVVGADYDPLLAKLMVVAADRSAALARLARAIAEFEIGGVQTTLPFHRWLVEQPGFADGSSLATDFVERSWQPAPIVEAAARRAAAVAASAPRRPAQLAPPPATQPAASEWWLAGLREQMAGLPDQMAELHDRMAGLPNHTAGLPGDAPGGLEDDASREGP